MKKTTPVIAAVLFLCLPLASLGAPPTASHTKAAEDLSEAMQMEARMNQNIEAVIQAQITQDPEMKKAEGVIRDFFNKYMGWKITQPQILAIYTETFTEAELREINAFYRTPTGQKYTTVMPILFQKIFALGQNLIQDHIGELHANIQEKLKADDAKEE